MYPLSAPKQKAEQDSCSHSHVHLFMDFFNKRVLALSRNVRIALEAGLQSRECFCLLEGYLPFE